MNSKNPRRRASAPGSGRSLVARHRASHLNPDGADRLGYRPALDGLRAVAVLAVISWHYVVPGIKGGFLGVDVFFVLSGFLITKLLLEEWASRSSIHLGRFYLRRALFLLLLVTAPIVERIWSFAALLYVTNWGLLLGRLGSGAIMQLWSLSIEEQFYLVWPLLLLVMLRSRMPRPAILALVAALAATSAVFKIVAWHSPEDWSRFYFGSDSRADELLIGCWLALFLVWSRLPRQEWFRLALQVATIPAIAFLGYEFITSAVYKPFLYHGGGLTLVALASAVVVANLLLAPFAGLLAILESRPLVAIGRMSYGLYLWHSPVGWVTDGRHYGWVPPMSRPVLLLVRVGLTFVIAAGSYRFVERPMLALKRRFSPDRIDAA